jgi:hypothetical protein
MTETLPVRDMLSPNKMELLLDKRPVTVTASEMETPPVIVASSEMKTSLFKVASLATEQLD